MSSRCLQSWKGIQLYAYQTHCKYNKEEVAVSVLLFSNPDVAFIIRGSRKFGMSNTITRTLDLIQRLPWAMDSYAYY